jgi:hypothetical protein
MLQAKRIVVSSKYGAILSQYGAIKVAAASLIAQNNSQIKMSPEIFDLWFFSSENLI